MARSSAETGQRRHEIIKRVAYLCAEGVSQKRIAGLLALSPSMVSRLVDQAKKAALLEETVRCLLPDEEQAQLREEVFGSEKLRTKLKRLANRMGVPSLTHLQIIPTGQEIEGDLSWDQAVVVFGHKAAPYCLELISACQNVGVTYGRTLAALANGLQELATASFRTKRPIAFVPLWGEPLRPWEKPASMIFRDPARLSSSGLAATLHGIFHEHVQRAGDSLEDRRPLSLDFVPAFRPERYPEDRFRVVLEFASSVSSYADIFWGPEDRRRAGTEPQDPESAGCQAGGLDTSDTSKPALVEELDAIITSVGSKDQPGRFWSGEFWQQGDIDLAQLCRGALGDLGGAFIVDPQAEEDCRDYVAAVNERWNGVREDHFRSCAVRARESDSPGVIVFAVGAVRAKVILQCLKLGLINHLVLDSDCAQALSGLL